MPPELQPLQPYLPEIAAALAGLFIGWLITRLAAGSRHATAAERLKSEERRAAEIEARLAQMTDEFGRNEQNSSLLRG